ncbi:sensor histidine kinase [Acidithrix ferrooxidans]|uniref:histidine kinase n=1 Tax=Acidithrix ferrooxidans TaxID=1280514 RepID=A0A0D8HEK3_9ACTN|nr:ATP-binding protein [Acidithrix ferrooxidans]KJF16375.1 sensor protein KdpD [Acidithrix ferrooxidans]
MAYDSSKEFARGIGGVLVATIIFGVPLFFIRGSISVATSALVFVVPVVIGTVIGGFRVGVIGAAIGFLVYDFFFIPPFYTLSVGADQNWIALGVYVMVVLVVSRVVSNLGEARAISLRESSINLRLFELSQMLIGDKSLSDLANSIALNLYDAFILEFVVILVENSGALEPIAVVGKIDVAILLEQFKADNDHLMQNLDLGPNGELNVDRLFAIALTVQTKPVGILVVKFKSAKREDLRILNTFANQAGLALNHARLAQEAKHARMMAESQRWQRALLGTVSHDLRTPLTAIKASISNLRDPCLEIEAADRDELFRMIEAQADRLSRLVVNLLDMSRLEAGALEPRFSPVEIDVLIEEGIDSLMLTGELKEWIEIFISPEVPDVMADHTLVAQVVGNLLDNAIRHSPANSVIDVAARLQDGRVLIEIRDRGPGVDKEDESAIFRMFEQRLNGGRAGIGLAIAKAFVEAHGERISVRNAPDGGAIFFFTLAIAPMETIHEL